MDLRESWAWPFEKKDDSHLKIVDSTKKTGKSQTVLQTLASSVLLFWIRIGHYWGWWSAVCTLRSTFRLQLAQNLKGAECCVDREDYHTRRGPSRFQGYRSPGDVRTLPFTCLQNKMKLRMWNDVRQTEVWISQLSSWSFAINVQAYQIGNTWKHQNRFTDPHLFISFHVSFFEAQHVDVFGTSSGWHQGRCNERVAPSVARWSLVLSGFKLMYWQSEYWVNK